MGYSFCRFACGTPDEEMGSIDLYDGVWVWPEGLAHYVECHSVCLPDEFIETMRARTWQIPENIKLRSGAERTVLKLVGYWRWKYEADLPDPRALVRPGRDGDDLLPVLGYLRAGRNYILDLWEDEDIRGDEGFDEQLYQDLSFWKTWAGEETAASRPR